jgi:6-phosphogluconolactonase (cycloisomerase 2 family)
MVRHKTYLYVGNWGNKENELDNGFGIFFYDEQTGEVQSIKRAFEEMRIGATCFNPHFKDVLYFVDERISCNGKGFGGSQVIAARLTDMGDMVEINRQPTFAPLPSYVCTDRDGRYLIVTNHGAFGAVTKAVLNTNGKYQASVIRDDSSIVLYPIEKDGLIGEACDIYQLQTLGRSTTSGVPHPHIVKMSPDGSVFAVCDRGTDMVHLFKINYEKRALVPCGAVHCTPGSNPRYCVFHPTSLSLIANNETMPILSVFKYNDKGILEHISDVASLPQNTLVDEKTLQSDIQIHPNGKYIYNLVRGVNMISVFDIDESTGIPALIQAEPVAGEYPKGCAVAPDGRFLLVAAKNSSNVCLYSIDSNGKILFTGYTFKQPHPATFTFYKPNNND